MKNLINNKNIIVIHQRDWGIYHGFEISKKMENMGANLSSISFKKYTEYYIENQKQIKFNFVLNESEVFNNFKSIIDNNNYGYEQFYKDYGIDTIWKYAFTLRSFSLNYSKKFPFSYEQYLDDQKIYDYILAYGFKLKELFEKCKPDLVIGYNCGDLRHLLINKLSDIYKIPFFFASDTKVQNILSFYYDYKGSKSFFKDRIKKLNSQKKESKNIFKATSYIEEHRKNFKKPTYVSNLNFNESLFNQNDFKKLLKKIIYYLKQRPQNNELNTSSDRIKLSLLFRDFFTKKINIYKTKKFTYDNIDKIDRFVFFPLQHYPESQLGLLNPVHENQLRTAQIIARYLPKNITLVVKDHPWSFGLRSVSYLNKLKNSMNIKLIKFDVDNSEIYKKMDCLISLNGTSIFEAAIIKKPAIQIGELEMMTELPNFYLLKDLYKIDELLNKILKEFPKKIAEISYDKKLIDYIAAAMDTGFEANKYESDFRKEKSNLEYTWKHYLIEINKIFNFKDKFIY